MVASGGLKTFFRITSRLLLYVLLTTAAVDAKAVCDGTRLKLLFSPTFGPGFMREFFSDVTALLESNGCLVSISHVNTFQELFDKIRTQKHDVLIIPSLFNEEIKAFGYTRKLSGFDGTKGYIVVRRSGQYIRLRDLVGQTIYINDPLSMAAAEWIRITKEKGIYKQINVEYGGKLDSLLFRLMNSEIDTTHSIDILYDKLPDEYKEKLLIIHRFRLNAPASILFAQRLPKPLVNKLTNEIEKQSERWRKLPIPSYEIDKEFLTRLRKSLYPEEKTP